MPAGIAAIFPVMGKTIPLLTDRAYERIKLELITCAIELLLDEMTRLPHLGLGLRNRSQEMQHEHRALVKALLRGDGSSAERICRDQIEAARNMVLSAILTSSI